MPMKSSTLLITLLALLCAGCVQEVKPWQKGDLARSHMSVEPDAIQRAIREQIAKSKESSSGGYSVVGGGCGCN